MFLVDDFTALLSGKLLFILEEVDFQGNYLTRSEGINYNKAYKKESGNHTGNFEL